MSSVTAAKAAHSSDDELSMELWSVSLSAHFLHRKQHKLGSDAHTYLHLHMNSLLHVPRL